MRSIESFLFDIIAYLFYIIKSFFKQRRNDLSKRLTRRAFLHWRLDKLIREAEKRGFRQAVLFFQHLRARLISYPQAYKRESWEPVNVTLATVVSYSAKDHLRALDQVGVKKVEEARRFIRSIDLTVDFRSDELF